MQRLGTAALVAALLAIGWTTTAGALAACSTGPGPHLYVGGGGIVIARPDGERVVMGKVTVWDSCVASLRTQAPAGTYSVDVTRVGPAVDGDYDVGIGGAFFGAGPWADESICGYGLDAHGTSVTVVDLVNPDIRFVTAADDQNGPVIISLGSGRSVCETDGNISPGDPAVDPTADADDCMSATFVSTGTACGTGGDGGYWVALVAARFNQQGQNTAPAPTQGWIYA